MRVQPQNAYAPGGEVDGVQAAGEVQHAPGLSRHFEQPRVKGVHGCKRQAFARGSVQGKDALKRRVAALRPRAQQLSGALCFLTAEKRPSHAVQLPPRGAVGFLGLGVTRLCLGVGALHQRAAEVVMLLHRAKAPSVARKSAGCAPSSGAGRRGLPSSADG